MATDTTFSTSNDIVPPNQQLFVLSRVRAGKVDALITVDVETQESITYSSTVTDHPVEEGSDITDHIRPDPEIIQAQCVVSNTPITADDFARAGGTQAQILSAADTARATTLGNGQSLTAPIKGFSPVTAEVPDYADRVHKQLKDLRDKGTMVTVISPRGRFPNMVVQSVGIPTSSENFNGLEFSITFKHIRIVQNKLTRNVVASDKRPGNKVRKGKVIPKPAPVDDRDAALQLYESQFGKING